MLKNHECESKAVIDSIKSNSQTPLKPHTTTISPHIMGKRKVQGISKIFLGRPFYALNSSIEGVELIKISQRYTLILRIASCGYAYPIRDEAKNITFRLQMHMENPCSCVGIVWGKLSKIC